MNWKFWKKKEVVEKPKRMLKWHWSIDCVECKRPLAITKEKMYLGQAPKAEDLIGLTYLKEKPENGKMVACKCGSYAVNGGRRITDKTWKRLKKLEKTKW